MNKWVSFVMIALLSATVSTVVQAARVVEAEGSAVITDGAIGKARNLAVQNAIRQALLQDNAFVDTSTLISEKVLVSEHTKISAMGMVKDVKIISERIEERLIHVKIRAKVREQGDKPISPASRYLKKVAAVQFHVMDRSQIHDLPNVESVLPRELLRYLEKDSQVTAVDATQYGLWANSQPGSNQQADERRMVSNLASELGVQFIVAGVIHDMDLHRISLFEDVRTVAVEVLLYDGVSGALIARHRFQKEADDADYLDSGITVGGSEFYQTSTGARVAELLQWQAAKLKTELSLLPFTAKVIRSEGSKVYFNAGRTSLVNVGDVLMSYRLDPDPVEETGSGDFLGYIETPVASITVTQTQPLFAIGQLETDQVKLAPGDIIRFGH